MEGEYYVKPPPWTITAVLERTYVRFAKFHHQQLMEGFTDTALFERGRNMMLWLGHHVTIDLFRETTATRSIVLNADSIGMSNYRVSVDQLEALIEQIEDETGYRKRQRAQRTRPQSTSQGVRQ